MSAVDTSFGITIEVQKRNELEPSFIPAIAYTAYVYVKGILARTRGAESEHLALYVGRLMAEDIRAAHRFPLRSRSAGSQKP